MRLCEDKFEGKTAYLVAVCLSKTHLLKLPNNNNRATVNVTIIQDGGAREIWKQK